MGYWGTYLSFPRHKHTFRCQTAPNRTGRIDLRGRYRGGVARQRRPTWHGRVRPYLPSLGRLRWAFRAEIVEATTGFEPVNRGFADPRVEPLHHVAPRMPRRGAMLA